MNITPFYGREEELERLNWLRKKKTSSLIVIKGRRRIGKSRLIKEVRQKMERIAKPKNVSMRPILIHVNGVTDAVIESEFFANIIDFSRFL